MRGQRAIGVVLAAVLTTTLPAGAAYADPTDDSGRGRPPAEVDPSTRENALAAMHGEAYAYAAYRAYADEAERAGEERVAWLFRRTARQERGEHFAEIARLIRFVGSNVDNLTDAIEGEQYEATVMYPEYARQAEQDGCDAAADLFTEIAEDETRHAAWYEAARTALTDPDADQNFPVGERVPTTPIPAGPAQCTGQTLANLYDAMHGEALASAKYRLYAAHAWRTGEHRVAELFANAASQELNEHFAEEAALAGLVQSTDENLRTAIAGEREEATVTYPGYRDQAEEVGDRWAARLFDELASDEARHAYRFTRALDDLG
ncbi:ferritin family protein [Plantactinospora sp. GCM10030261]|uniref:ferritin family protein n=1 Tax=Plantactinospora sp. GCM10030261 TaxID=3273420 RepID=UPI0036100C00